MNKLTLFIIPALLLTLTGLPATKAKLPPPELDNVQTREMDERAKILVDYFAKYNSPLENHAQDFIDAADQNGVDWKLVPAISGVESTFGKAAYGYNAWGWGIYGNQALGFGSWRDGIFTVTGGLKQNYINKGLTEPLSMNRVYAASPTWGVRVNYFMRDLDKFADDQGRTEPQLVGHPLSKVAASSARLDPEAERARLDSSLIR